ncbi:MAG: hypothetical protein VB034_14205 [Eubacteriales bacterium]|nr:hypothetical protein [Eubacteriales bacterium]
MNINKRLFQVIPVLFLFVLTLVLCPVHFLLNDDYALMQLVAGWRSGTPEFYNVYNNVIYSAPLSLLYRLCGNIPWYPLVQIVILFFASYTIWKTMRKNKSGTLGAVFVLLSFLCLFLCGILPNLVYLQYSIVAAIAGSAACILFLDGETGRGHGYQIILFVLLSFLIRQESGIVMLCMLLGTLAMRHMKKREPIAKKALPRKQGLSELLIISLAVLFCFGAGLVQKSVETSPNVRNYTEFNALRTRYMDYGDHPTYQESDVYQRIGWSENLYDMTRNWFFMDERVSAETLSAILSEGKAPAVSEKLASVPSSFLETLKETNMVRDLFLLFIWLTAATVLCRLLNREYLSALRDCLPAACFFIASLYLCYQGRYPQHAFYVCILPACTLLFYDWTELEKGGRLMQGVMVLALAGMFFLAYNSAEHVVLSSRSGFYQNKEILSDEVDAYAAAHPKDIIITDYSIQGSGKPWKRETDDHPLNRFFWGGWYYQSPFYYTQLQKNGRHPLYAQDFYDSNVRLVSASPKLLEDFLAYLTATYGKTRAIPVLSGPRFTVYRFLLDTGETPR